MDIEKIIKSRHSVRGYLDKEIEIEKTKILSEMINKINKENNLHFQLILNDKEVFDNYILHYGKLKNAKNYIALIGKNSKNLDEICGYFGEQLVLKATELNLNTCWVAGTYNKKYLKANIKSNEKLVCIIAIGYGETSGKEHKSKTFNEVSKSIDVPSWYKKGIEYALLAPTAINEQKFKFEYISGNKVKVKPGFGPMTKIDLGIVKYHFELGANMDIDWQ